MQWTLSGQSVAAAKRTCGVCATEGLQNTATGSRANVPAIRAAGRPFMPGTLRPGNLPGQDAQALLWCDLYLPGNGPMPGSTYGRAGRSAGLLPPERGQDRPELLDLAHAADPQRGQLRTCVDRQRPAVVLVEHPAEHDLRAAAGGVQRRGELAAERERAAVVGADEHRIGVLVGGRLRHLRGGD